MVTTAHRTRAQVILDTGTENLVMEIFTAVESHQA